MVPGATLCTGTPVPVGWPPSPASVSPHKDTAPCVCLYPGASCPPCIRILGRRREPPCSCPRENTLFPSRRKRPSGGSGHTGRRQLSGQCTAHSRLLSTPATPAARGRVQTPALSRSALSPRRATAVREPGTRGLSTRAHPTRPDRPGEAAAAGPGSPSQWRSGPPGPGGLTCTQN